MDVEEKEEEEEDNDAGEEDRSQDRKAHFVQACAVEMHMDISQEPFCVEIYTKSSGRQSRDTRFVQACAIIETNMDISQELFQFCMDIYRKSPVRQSRDTRFVGACAGETPMDISQEPFCVEINAGSPGYHLD